MSFYQCLSSRRFNIAEAKGVQMDPPPFIPLSGIAGFAAREKISQSMSKATEKLLPNGGIDVVPRFRGAATVNAYEVGVDVLSELLDSRTHELRVVDVTWRNRRGKGMIHSSRSPGDDGVRFQVLPN